MLSALAQIGCSTSVSKNFPMRKHVTNHQNHLVVVMVTPIMIANIGWGTYLFFAIINFCFVPFLWFFYPETARRSLEEIDIIFAKGYVENISYVKAAEDLPLLTAEQIEEHAIKYGLIETAANIANRHAGRTDPEALVSEKGARTSGAEYGQAESN